MKIGLIDADNRHHGPDNLPNLALMKLAAWHKKQGDSVEWYEPLWSGHMNRVYIRMNRNIGIGKSENSFRSTYQEEKSWQQN